MSFLSPNNGKENMNKSPYSQACDKWAEENKDKEILLVNGKIPFTGIYTHWRNKTYLLKRLDENPFDNPNP